MLDKTNLEKYELANKWLHLQNKNVSIFENLRKNGINRIIIYGASDFALRLIEQCENEKNMKIIAIADKMISEKKEYYQSIPLVSIDNIQSMQDDNTCIVIAAVGFQDEIINDFNNRKIKNFILLRDLIYDAY